MRLKETGVRTVDNGREEVTGDEEGKTKIEGVV